MATSQSKHFHCKLNFYCTGSPLSKSSAYNGTLKLNGSRAYNMLDR